LNLEEFGIVSAGQALGFADHEKGGEAKSVAAEYSPLIGAVEKLDPSLGRLSGDVTASVLAA
jgi:hypothetical protein